MSHVCVHNDRGLRNLVPAMPLNRIVLRYPGVRLSAVSLGR